jgi:hypothetical protein
MSCAKYAKRNGLIDTPGWKPFRHLAKIDKKVEQMVNQDKLKSYRRDPFCRFLVPPTHNQAVEIDLAYLETHHMVFYAVLNVLQIEIECGYTLYQVNYNEQLEYRNQNDTKKRFTNNQ